MVVWMFVGFLLYDNGTPGVVAAIVGLIVAAVVMEIYLRLLWRCRVWQAKDRKRNPHHYL